MDGQGTKCRRKIAENYNRLSRANKRYRQTDRQTTDGRATANSEREREFTFAVHVRQKLTIIINLPVYQLNQGTNAYFIVAKISNRIVFGVFYPKYAILKYTCNYVRA